MMDNKKEDGSMHVLCIYYYLQSEVWTAISTYLTATASTEAELAASRYESKVLSS